MVDVLARDQVMVDEEGRRRLKKCRKKPAAHERSGAGRITRIEHINIKGHCEARASLPRDRYRVVDDGIVSSAGVSAG
mgnify:CR=1 FL=1